MHGATASDNVASWELKTDSNATMGSAIAITSSSLKVAANATAQATIELEWVHSNKYIGQIISASLK
jgi:hypothetical protein